MGSSDVFFPRMPSSILYEGSPTPLWETELGMISKELEEMRRSFRSGETELSLDKFVTRLLREHGRLSSAQSRDLLEEDALRVLTCVGYMRLSCPNCDDETFEETVGVLEQLNGYRWPEPTQIKYEHSLNCITLFLANPNTRAVRDRLSDTPDALTKVLSTRNQELTDARKDVWNICSWMRLASPSDTDVLRSAQLVLVEYHRRHCADLERFELDGSNAEFRLAKERCEGFQEVATWVSTAAIQEAYPRDAESLTTKQHDHAD